MSPAAPSRRIQWGVAGIATIAIFLYFISRFWHPVYGFTELLQLDASNDDVKIAAFHDLPVYVYRNTGGYDGLYYAQIAYHPLLDAKELLDSADNLAYRARRILPPAVAWLLAGGRPSAIVYVYSFLNVAVWLAFAAFLWRVLEVADGRRWVAWAGILLSAGAVASVRLALTDLPAAALATAAIWIGERGRGRWAVGLMAAAGLSRETALAGVPALWRRPWISAANAARALLAVLPLAAWILYVRWRVGPADPGWSNFDWPFVGLVEKGAECVGAFAGTVAPSYVVGTLLATVALVVQAAYMAARPEPANPWWRLGAAYSVMLVLLGQPVWEDFPGASMRVLLPLTIGFNILVVRRRAALAWLVAGNLGVAAGLVALRNPPVDLRELAAVHPGGVAVIARVENGWSNHERDSRHVWAWCDGQGRVAFEVWPQERRILDLHFQLRSLDRRRVVIREKGRVVWQGGTGAGLVSVDLPVTVESGRAALDFSTDHPPEQIVEATGARPLAFAIYDLRIAVPAVQR